MRLLIDANVVLDVLQKREPYWKDSSVIWKLCETEQIEGYISTLTFANLMYVMRRELDPAQIRDVLDKLRLIFRFADFTAADMEKAAEMGWDDFEDAIQAATAERIMADSIITRNVRDFRNSKVIAFTPSEYIARL
ncbi:MAG: PIN domain-containing protein [Oscillospiraceae bacterium]|nr:PIN domain-containing protein [Oscillospiraceae bacterium]